MEAPNVVLDAIQSGASATEGVVGSVISVVPDAAGTIADTVVQVGAGAYESTVGEAIDLAGDGLACFAGDCSGLEERAQGYLAMATDPLGTLEDIVAGCRSKAAHCVGALLGGLALGVGAGFVVRSSNLKPLNRIDIESPSPRSAQRRADGSLDLGQPSLLASRRTAGSDTAPGRMVPPPAATARVSKGTHACSFSADTPVLLADGTTIAIAELDIGDMVLATDPTTDETGRRAVTDLFVHDDVFVELTVDGAVLVTTDDHPFWNVTDQQWQAADQLDVGDQLLTAEGHTAEVEAYRDTGQSGDAYNFTVADLHTYYVEAGDHALLVHNACRIGNRVAGTSSHAPTGLTNGTQFEVLSSQPISGVTRTSHRAAANKRLLSQLEADPALRRSYDGFLDDDVVAHMRSGKSGLRNPPGTEWHHPIWDADSVFLLRRGVHRHPGLQGILHPGPGGSGGFAEHFGRGL